MANTSSRALRLLSLLQNHRFWPGAELAERLGVSSRTLRRDVDRLRELGYPVTAHPGVDGGYQLASGTALPPLVVDDDEAVALAVGLRLATQGASVPGTTAQDTADHGTIAEAAARALAKVTQVMPARLRRRAEAVAAMTESASWDAARAAQAAAINPDVLASAALACRDAERIRFPYGAANGERTERHVEPHRLVALDRRWYLVGYDLTRNDWRSSGLTGSSACRGRRAPGSGPERCPPPTRPSSFAGTSPPPQGYGRSRPSSRRRPRSSGSASAGGRRSRRTAPTAAW